MRRTIKFYIVVLVLMLTSIASGYLVEVGTDWNIHNADLTDCRIMGTTTFGSGISLTFTDNLTISEYMSFTPVDTAMERTEGVVRFSDANNCLEYWNGSAIVQLTSGTGDNTLDDAYDQGGAGAGRTITADTGAVTITNTDADAAFLLAVTPTPSAGAATGGISIVTGGNSTQDSLQITNAGTGYSISTDSDKFTVTKTGAGNFASTLGVGSNITLQNSMVIDQSVDNTYTWTENGENFSWTFGNNVMTVSSSTGIVSIDWGTIAPTFGAQVVASVGVASSDDITLTNGKSLKPSATSAETMKLQVYDNDTGPGYKDAMTFTNGNTPAVSVGGNATTVAIDSTDWDISAAGVMTGIGAITMDGLLTGTLGATISGATVSLNNDSNFGVNIGTGTSTGAIAVGGGSGTFALASTGLDVSTTGALTNAASIAGANSNTINLAYNQRFEFQDNSEMFGFDVGSSGTAVEFVTDSGITTIDCNDVDRFTDVYSIAGDNGVTINISQNERFEVGDSETVGWDFATGNTVEWTTNTGITTMDFNDIDDLTDVYSIAGDNGVTINIGQNERFEVGDSETVGWGLSVANTLTWTTNSGVDTVDVNDLDDWTGFSNITGEGTGALGGFKKTVTNDGEPHAIAITESGKVLTNAGSDGADAWTLPDAAAGLEYTFVVMAAQEMRITPQAGDKIIYGSTAMTAGEYYYADAVGESLYIVAVDSVNWVVISSTGTWAEETP